MATFMATSAVVTTGLAEDCRVRAVMTFWPAPFTHSGQWKPTEAWFMHDGQMGRSQRWQRTPARRSLWR
ncbi:MAG TPA: hypothetical protein DCS55_21990 [Acidimicrobiaceae bacterium]|nr:hypothetical protein [Acidimicrobiaceae bacterium]